MRGSPTRNLGKNRETKNFAQELVLTHFGSCAKSPPDISLLLLAAVELNHPQLPIKVSDSAQCESLDRCDS